MVLLWIVGGKKGKVKVPFGLESVTQPGTLPPQRTPSAASVIAIRPVALTSIASF